MTTVLPNNSHNAITFSPKMGAPQPELEGWPTRFASPLAWKGPSFTGEATYTYTISEDEAEEIFAALQHFKTLGLDGHEVARDNFPIPTLGAHLQSQTVDLHRGKGFFVLRGLDPAHLSPEDNIIVFLGISSYIGEKRGMQNDKGDMFTHIQNAKYMRAHQEDRPIKDSSIASTFHTDTCCDILAMQTRSCAEEGGNHVLASSLTVYNELAATRPDVLETLASPSWKFDNRAQFAQANKRPLLFYHGGHVILNFMREPLVGFGNVSSSDDTSPPSPKQLEALEAVQRIAEKHQVALNMQPGDLTFINNFALLHSRESFKDSPVHARYHVRMWLKNEKLAWKLPRTLQLGNDLIFKDREVEENWNVVAAPRFSFEIKEKFTS